MRRARECAKKREGVEPSCFCTGISLALRGLDARRRGCDSNPYPENFTIFRVGQIPSTDHQRKEKHHPNLGGSKTGISSKMNIPAPCVLKASFQIFGREMRTFSCAKRIDKLCRAMQSARTRSRTAMRNQNKREITARVTSLLLVEHQGLEPWTDRL